MSNQQTTTALEAAASVLELSGVPGATLAVPVLRAVAAEHARRVSKALAAAERISGLSREELLEWVTNHPPSMPIVTRVLLAAGNSGNDMTLEMLGGALGQAARQRDPGDEQEMLVLAIEGLTQQQIEVIAACSEEDFLSTAALTEALDGRVSTDIVSSTAYSLVPRGVFVNPYGRYGGSEAWQLSPLGAAVVLAAREAAQ